MRTRNRSHDDGAPPGAAGSASTAGTDQRRQAADRLVAEADAAIERALAGDSQRFLDANQQSGGQ